MTAFVLKTQKRKTKSRDILKRNAQVLEMTMNGMGSAEIGEQLGYAVHKSQCQRIIQIQNELTVAGKLSKNEGGSFVIPSQNIDQHKWTKMTKEVAEMNVPQFKKFAEYAKVNGRTQQSISTELSALVVVCNTTGIHPSEIINAKTITGEENYIVKLTEVMMDFKEKLQTGNAELNKHSNHNNHEAKQVRRYSQAMRHMCHAYGRQFPRFPPQHILSGTKGDTFGAYNDIALTDKLAEGAVAFIEKNGKDILGEKHWDYGFVIATALMPEMITRTESILQWKVEFQTEHDEYEHNPVEYDFVTGFYEPKTKDYWNKFIVSPLARKMLKTISEYRMGKTIMPFNKSTASIERRWSQLMKEYYISLGILPETVRLSKKTRPDDCIFQQKTKQFFYDERGIYVLRHTGAHQWCRWTNYDYGFVADLGWKDMNTLKEVYAGQTIKQRLKQDTCFYCQPPMNPDAMESKVFCKAQHAFIYYSNGGKSKVSQN